MAAPSPPSRADDVTLTFGGNATTLLRLGPFTLLTDPYERFRATREEDLDYAAVVEAGANFVRACWDHGWEHAEG